MWLDGSLSSTEAEVFHGRVIIVHGLIRKRSVWLRRKKRNRHVSADLEKNSIGFAFLRKPVRQRVKHVLMPMRNFGVRTLLKRLHRLPSLFLMVRALAMLLSMRKN